ncbi:MAG TPA: DUF3343 domain-containing protein [Methylomusa anaerophila]|uniref:Putative Se/S carrier protein-like domain-containing protein n=1 Tax=Methylomusa anaerophila TaxID=1930071 RepID=A0A348AHR1_9FIRM|nr:DUF3343 domain-containing protein [Methylomusa anaerophila]BBB90609.1 hypothetical protein MAMMFC1_01263 [Methylomusa anaerophila]HML88784.1 DUF3343 domain-containing protein [Methylomusa anaerophila]
MTAGVKSSGTEHYDWLISFASVHQAIKAEKILVQAGIKVTAMPTPREIDISCGQCLLIAAGDEAAAFKLFAAGQVRWAKLYRRTLAQGPGGPVKIYERVSENTQL